MKTSSGKQLAKKHVNCDDLWSCLWVWLHYVKRTLSK